MSSQSTKVRVGIQVTRNDSRWVLFTYWMFYCRQRAEALITRVLLIEGSVKAMNEGRITPKPMDVQ